MAKRKITLLYGEGTVQVYFRLPESKRDEIKKMFWDILKEYENPTKVEIDVKNSVEEVDVPKWKRKLNEKDSEKKTNPADDVFKAPAEKSQNLKNFESLVSDEVSPAMKDFVDEKKAKIAMLKEIATGNGPKKVGSFITEKAPLEERYNFEEWMSLPDIDSRVIIGTKGIAFYDRYDPSFSYVRYSNRMLKFSDRKEFDKFVKQEGILL